MNIPEKKQKSGSAGVLTFVFFMFFLICVNVYWPEGRAALQKLFCPWGRQKVQLVWERLVVQLQSGFPLIDAVETFCTDLIRGAIG